MGKLEEAKRAAAEAARWRAEQVGTSPPERREVEVQRAVNAMVEADPTIRAVSVKRGRLRPVEGGPTRVGRPTRAEGPSEITIAVRVTPAENGKLILLANQAELPLSVWAREVLLREAGK